MGKTVLASGDVSILRKKHTHKFFQFHAYRLSQLTKKGEKCADMIRKKSRAPNTKEITSGKKATNIINTNMCSKKNSLIPTKKLPLLNIKQEYFLRWQIFFVQKKN